MDYKQNLDLFFSDLTSIYQFENEKYKKNLVNFLNDFEFRYKILRQLRKQTDPFLSPDFNIFHFIEPDENKISDIMVTLLNPYGSHGQGDIYLKLFLEQLSNLPASFKIEQILSKYSDIEREVYTKHGRRIDILISFKNYFVIAIENKPNKPWTKDQEGQIKDYICHIGNDPFFFIYLPPFGEEPNENSISKGKREKLTLDHQFEIISYHIHIRQWIEKCWEKTKSERVRFFLQDFKDWVNENFKVDSMEVKEGE